MSIKLEIYRGDEPTYILTIKNYGANVNLTGYKIWFTVKESYSDADDDAVIQMSSADVSEIEILDQTSYKGQVKIYLSKTETALLSQGTYVFDVQMKTSAGKILTVVAGDLIVKSDVTLSTA